ncbi:MAG: hypothetical protein NTZ05_00665 [Chloroflexi bacterium]|nr:hypothetical protein [Chloroflexota bacterium]
MARSFVQSSRSPAASRLRWTGPRLALTAGLALLVGALLLRFGDGPRLLATAAGIWERPALLAVFLTTYAAAFAVRAWVWRLLTPGGPGLIRLLGILHVALLANHVFPTKAGELIRMGLLTRRGVPLGTAASSTALARLLDFLALCCVALTLGAVGEVGPAHDAASGTAGPRRR